MKKQKLIATLFAAYGRENKPDAMTAYLFALREWSDAAVAWAVEEALAGRIGDPAFLPSAPQLAVAARAAPERDPESQPQRRLNDLPPVWKMMPGNTRQMTAEAIVFYGIERAEQWMDNKISITPEVLLSLAEGSLKSSMICLPSSDECKTALRQMARGLALPRREKPLLVESRVNGIAAE